MSLKRRLIALLLAVTFVGLASAALIVNAIVSITLNSRAVDQLEQAEVRASSEFLESSADTSALTTTKRNYGGRGPGAKGGPIDPGGITAILFDADNTEMAREEPPFAESIESDMIPSNVLDRARKSSSPVRFQTGDYIGDAIKLNDAGAVSVTLVSTSGSAETIHQLLLAELAVGLGVLLVVGAGSSLIIRVGLKPLRAMAAAADGIAGGDTSQRIPRGGGHEVDGLAASLNSAFDARDASEARLRTFIADASHELRTPLTSIRGYAQLVERGIVTEPGDVKSAAGRIERESTRLAGMVSTLLSLTRLDLGRSIDKRPVELTVVAADALSDAQVSDPQRTYTMRARCTAPVLGDEAQLRQVLSNLLGNARDHTPPGTEVAISVHQEGERIKIDVIDHGPGVPDEFKGKIFDRFFRLDEAHGRNDAGHGGLGLAIVQAIVGAHGGSVTVVDTDPGGAQGTTGATFRICLPLAAAGFDVGDDEESYVEPPVSSDAHSLSINPHPQVR